jgi:hypothetical protein
MCAKLFREDYANILIFLAYHSQDTYLVESIIKSCNYIFSAEKECEFKEDINSVRKIAKSDNMKYKLSGRSASQEREAAAESRDKMEARIAEHEQDDPSHDVNRAFKAIQVAGQVLRAYQGTLNKDLKLQLAQQCHNLSLRMSGFILRTLGENVAEIIDALNKGFFKGQKDPEKANSILYKLCQLVVVGLNKRVSNNIGNKNLRPTFDQLVQENPSIGNRLINLSIRLDHFGELSLDEIEALNEEFKNDHFVLGIIKLHVLHHLTFFEVDYRTRQRISQILGFSMAKTEILEIKSSNKKIGTSKNV